LLHPLQHHFGRISKIPDAIRKLGLQVIETAFGESVANDYMSNKNRK
jgi:hypothetical protein